VNSSLKKAKRKEITARGGKQQWDKEEGQLMMLKNGDIRVREPAKKSLVDHGSKEEERKSRGKRGGLKGRDELDGYLEGILGNRPNVGKKGKTTLS